MGFKLPGKSITEGTSGHRSALKMQAEANASPAKYGGLIVKGAQRLLPAVIKKAPKIINKSKGKIIDVVGKTVPSTSSKILSKAKTIGKHILGYTALDAGINYFFPGDDGQSASESQSELDKITKTKKKSNGAYNRAAKRGEGMGYDLNDLVRQRKTVKKGSDEYNAIQNKINKAYGVKKRHGATNVSTTGTKGVFGGKDVKTTTRNTPGISDFQAETVTSRGGRKKVTTKRYEDDKGVTTKKHKSKYRKSGVEKKRKSVYKTDWDKDGKIDKKTRVKVKKDASGNVKRKKVVTKEGGVRTVTKTNRKGETKTRSRKTLNPFD